MSFKSKQRMKHSHLFGDDPLNASSTSLASDDPLFGSSATTGRSSGRATPSDPLSTRSSRPSSPSSLFEPSSASGSPRLNAKRLTNGTSSHSGSIFGDIDVSKLGGNGIFNGKKSASLRASASSTLRNVDDDDEDALFGGGGSSSPSRSGSRGAVASAASAAARPSLSSASSTSTRSSASDIERKPVQPTIPPSAPKKQPPPPPPTSASSTPPLRKENETTTNAIPEVQSNRSTGSSSLFSRFIKSKPSTPTGSGQASPIERQHQDRSAPPLAETTSLTPGTTMKRTSTKAPPPPVPPRQFPSSSPDPSNSVSTQKLEQKRPVVEEDYEEEEEEEENAPAVVIEDEATRAFAEDVHFDTPTYKLPSTYDDPEILASLTNDTLRLDDRPPMTPSISTPAVAYSQQQRSPLNDMYSEALNPWSSLGGPSIDPLFSRTASTSSPLLKNEQKVKVSEIDPSKRSAFADLIDSWNGKQRIEKRDTRPDELFFNKVAEEQRDIGFAGLDGNDKVTTQSFEGDTRNWNIVDNDNPWR